jgi:Fe-S oxidoreductase/nitrate reductase gamma subunit
MSLRELFWAGQEVYLAEYFLPIIIGTLVFLPVIILLFAFGFGRHYRLWRLGKADNRFEHWRTRLKSTLAVAVANVRILRWGELYPGVMHTLIVGGTALLFLGKIARLFSYPVGLTNPPQSVFLYSSFASEFGALLIIFGGGMAVYRRYIVKPPRLDNKPEDNLVFVWVSILLLTGFMIKGYRIAVSEVGPTDWPMWSPISYLFSHIFPTFVDEAKDDFLVLHRALFHAIPAVILFGYMWVNRSRLQHILISPLNVFFRTLKPKGALVPIDIETAETFGASNIEDFTWKQLMDLDACTRCGRCQDACPAYFSGKALNPKQVILDLKGHLYEVYPIPMVRKPAESRKDMISEAVTDEVIWDCTTCRACQQACPVYIEHVDKIVDMRRHLVMERTQLPEAAQEALKSLDTRFHPFRGTTLTRTDWADGLDIKVLSEDSDVDILYWVGCTAALEDRNVKVSQATARILQAAGINFGILGAEETCCGDPARRMGNEYLFQTICQSNVEILKGYNVKKIVTACPHCFNTIKHEYPQFGGSFEIIHHSQLIADLIGEGRLKPGKTKSKGVAYHDPCYLGRYNDIYEPPREILRTVYGIDGMELPRSGASSFCCGGGGGHMWMEEEPDKRVNVRRVDEIIEAKLDLVATACPYCLTMFEDGLKTREVEESIQARDVSEIVAEAL